jgi:hypothetical protein
MSISLLPEAPGGWPEYGLALFAVDRAERESAQIEAIRLRFARLRDKIPALKKLAEKQGVDRIDQLEDVLKICFDHRVLKNYPLSILENRDFPKLTTWLDKLTLHDLSKVDLSGLTTIDSWIDRLQEFGLIVGTSSGTTGKLSFVARSKNELSAWRSAWLLTLHAATGVNPLTITQTPSFSTGYRSGHQMALKTSQVLQMELHGGEDGHYTLYNGHMSADLLALSGKMQAAENTGDLDRLNIDAALVAQRRQMIEQAKRRTEDLQSWFETLIEDFRGKPVRIGGMCADLYRVAKAGKDKGLKPEFAPGTIVSTGGGMKGAKDVPDNWKDIIMDFFGVDRLSTMYGFSENIAAQPECSAGFYHFLPFSVPMLMDADGKLLPRNGVHKGRLAVFDLLAESFWGGFVSGDEVTLHMDDDCPCGWKGPRIEKSIRRYSEMEGGDDKITCSGSVKAYDEFMDYVMSEQ